jgi:hypothetical protein
MIECKKCTQKVFKKNTTLTVKFNVDIDFGQLKIYNAMV